jgi:hypothetical protein
VRPSDNLTAAVVCRSADKVADEASIRAVGSGVGFGRLLQPLSALSPPKADRIIRPTSRRDAYAARCAAATE